MHANKLNIMFLKECSEAWQWSVLKHDNEVNTIIRELQSGKSYGIVICVINKNIKSYQSNSETWHLNYLMEVGKFPV